MHARISNSKKQKSLVFLFLVGLSKEAKRQTDMFIVLFSNAETLVRFRNQITF